MHDMMLSLLMAAAIAGQTEPPPSNPLVGTWSLEKFVDTPEGGAPVFAFGEQPHGLFVFTEDGNVSINLMRNPPVSSPGTDPDPDACIPDWYCSYFGTYELDPTGDSWVTRVTGANIPNYLGTEQRRRFRIEGDRMIISETYQVEGRTVQAERVLRRLGR